MKTLKYSYNNQSGMFRHKILVQKQVIEIDARKQQTSRFVDFGFYYAMKKTQKADEVLSADREQTSIVDRFVIKYSKRLNELIEEQGTQIRVLHGSLIYDVVSAINDNGMNETITLIAETEVLPSES